MTNAEKSDTKPSYKRVNVTLADEEYTRLRSILILKKKSVSEWIRIIIKDFLNKEEKAAQKLREQEQQYDNQTNQNTA